ncbi:MAG: hypothetical protein L3J20_01735 [Flavobacteriaceae bacterium]|nr:hypothetical protein [Flavobacteriaceae bacterium]
MVVLLKYIIKVLPLQKNVPLSASSRAESRGEGLNTGSVEGFCKYVFLIENQEQESRKLKASTLIEVLVASVLIIIVFTIASLTLNNVFKSTIKSNTHSIDTHINKLMYLYQHDIIGVKYQEDFKDWHISFLQQTENNILYVIVEAVQTSLPNDKTGAKKTITKKIINDNAQ